MSYTFYYDESNNIRSLHLTGGRFNTDSHDNPSPCFVLAGIAHDGDHAQSSCEELIASLRLPPTATELKFKQVAQRGFLDNLKSTKIAHILRWLIDSDYYLHYTNLNMEYWSLVDIIDDCCDHADQHSMLNYQPAGGRRLYMDYHKDALYYIMRKYKSDFLAVLSKYHYPNVTAKNAAPFIAQLSKIVNKNRQVSARFGGRISNVDLSRTNSLFKLFQMCRNIKSLDMVYTSHPFVLIDGLSIFYRHCIDRFSSSCHIFDNEYEIEKCFKKIEPIDGLLSSSTFKFVDSKKYPAVQVSDVISGLLKNYFTFIAQTSVTDIVEAKKSLNEKQLQCLMLLQKLIEKSDQKQSEFLYYIMSQIEHHKHAVLLFGKDAKDEFVQVIGGGTSKV
ncbi:hypothetical protein Hrubri_2866 [Herbaspirillum rubrisubalbicans M1]|uniref:DUF3800 domain-containing protein n=1 Tax=Herbaspirillum rubrisubalbicans TaxID=80842 RepID=UPI00073A8BF5|nr:DUF3800 domain-containing protein [Herbaspirillum rubrisubalbicans]ALU90040.1 hypothetical protein Hrubri_2866 [Herbaspirillum rubrisubalbicans M1]